MAHYVNNLEPFRQAPLNHNVRGGRISMSKQAKFYGITLLFLIAAALTSFTCRAAGDPSETTSKPGTPAIILKLDDLRSPTPAWKRTVEFLRAKNVKSSIGIICNSLEGDQKPYYDWIREVAQTGLVEFWNHGWDHKQWREEDKDVMEFKGPSYEVQKEHLTRSQQLGKEKLGITFHSFGPPFNATDDTTLKVLAEDPDLKVFLYGKPEQASAVPNLLILDRTQMNIENPLFVPNAQRIEHDYKILAATRDCITIQGHPDMWDEARFEEFQKLVNYLMAQGATFTTPFEYYLSKHPTMPTP